MSDSSLQHEAGQPGHRDDRQSGRSRRPGRPRGKRRWGRIAVASGAAAAAVVAGVAGGGYLFAHHLLSSVHRVSVAALDAPGQPVMPVATQGSMTVLLTSAAVGSPALGTAAGSSGALRSGLIMLIHLDASQRSGAIVSIPSNLVVSVPGHGRADLGAALAIGGPSLLVKTVERLTDVRINHYSVLSPLGALRVIDALGGVNVNVPYATTSGSYTFHQGINHINSRAAIAYARQPAVSEIGRELLQQNLIRSMLSKITHKRLFRSPAVDYRLVRALGGALAVDSNLSDSQLQSLALSLGNLGGSDGTFVAAPIAGGSATRGGDKPVHLNPVLGPKLWLAIRNDGVAAFALRYPRTLTSAAPG